MPMSLCVCACVHTSVCIQGLCPKWTDKGLRSRDKCVGRKDEEEMSRGRRGELMYHETWKTSA